MASAPTIATFTAAETYLAKARNKRSRRLASNRYVARVDEDTIALVLHTTAVVTYHRDGTFTIYGGGWNTVTTKRTIADYSPAHPSSDGHGAWIVGYTGETTPPRVRKCRTCKGAGTWQEEARCYGPQYVGWDTSTRTARYAAECSHGETAAHSLGMVGRSCYRCEGTGQADYGSRPIPVTVTASQPYRVDASGAFLGLADSVPYAPGHYSTSKPKTYYLPAEQVFSPHSKGAEIVSELAHVLPNLYALVTHPVTRGSMRLDHAIVSLNDRHRWTREQIADWLDTLDVDLRFTA